MRFPRPSLALLLLWALAAGAETQEKKEENDARFHSLLLAAAKSYPDYGRVEDVLRFAPTLCKAPPPVAVRLSASKDAGTHGRKLYFLYAWDAASYLKSPGKDHFKQARTPPEYEKKKAEQVIVKESWTCVPIAKEKEAEEAKKAQGDERTRFLLRKDGELFKAGERKDLFVMVKLEAAVEGTDAGWVYGTVSADGKSVTSSGRVASCMGCHEKAGAGRLFGLPAEK